MKTINVNGKAVKTNLRDIHDPADRCRSYPFSDGNDKKTMDMRLKENIFETDKEMFERLARIGYTKITFYRTTTCIRGIYDTIAFCK